MLHGFLNIDKPAGITSHDVVARVRRVVRQKRVGHAGTLDPAATGVLVVALGGATRLIEYVQDATTKRYRATVRLGITTATDDAEGDVLATAVVPALDRSLIEQMLAAFRGAIMQVPPMYSALHHDGRRLHELAREGITVDLPARPVTITQLELLDWSPQTLELDVMCSKGTYIRSLARDMGAALGCGGHLHALRRTAVGTFLIEQATPLGILEENPADIMSILHSPDLAVADWPAISVGAEVARQVRNGQLIALGDLDAQRARVLDADGKLLALVTRAGDSWQPEKVFDWT